MIKEYFIDGNNLIGKIPELWELQKTLRQASREKLAFQIDNYFFELPQDVTIFFDGFVNEPIPTNKARIIYCNGRTADEEIKSAIMQAKNPRTICVVSSDHSVMQFAKVSSCKVIKSENFSGMMKRKKNKSSEELRIKDISNDEIKKLFGV